MNRSSLSTLCAGATLLMVCLFTARVRGEVVVLGYDLSASRRSHAMAERWAQGERAEFESVFRELSSVTGNSSSRGSYQP